LDLGLATIFISE